MKKLLEQLEKLDPESRKEHSKYWLAVRVLDKQAYFDEPPFGAGGGNHSVDFMNDAMLFKIIARKIASLANPCAEKSRDTWGYNIEVVRQDEIWASVWSGQGEFTYADTGKSEAEALVKAYLRLLEAEEQKRMEAEDFLSDMESQDKGKNYL